MKWSLKIGRVAGIGLYVHWTFTLLIAFVAWLYYNQGQSWQAAAWGVALVLAVFVCIILHELGHALTAKRFGIKTRDITLLPIGGMARLERMPEDPKQELLVALGGPVVTLVIAAVLAAVVFIGWGPAGLVDIQAVGGNFLTKLALVNAFLLGFNVLPAFPMDGGRVLRATLHFYMDYVQATQIAARAGQMMAIFFGIAAIYWSFNPILLIIAIFVFFGAKGEERLAITRTLCRNVPVRKAMISNYATLHPGDTLQRAVDELLAGDQRDFPVADDGQLRGVLTRQALLGALASHGPEVRLGDLDLPTYRTVDEDSTLDRELEAMQSGRETVVPVMREGRFVGLLSLDNIEEWIMVESARRQPHVRRGEPRRQRQSGGEEGAASPLAAPSTTTERAT